MKLPNNIHYYSHFICYKVEVTVRRRKVASKSKVGLKTISG